MWNSCGKRSGRGSYSDTSSVELTLSAVASGIILIGGGGVGVKVSKDGGAIMIPSEAKR